MKVSLVSKTEMCKEYAEAVLKELPRSSEALMIYCARVSSPNQENPSYEKLLRYCFEKKHWSVFEMIDVTLEIETTRMISAQILRHRSFCFQEFSQRYAEVEGFEFPSLRFQDPKNRQSSVEPKEGELDFASQFIEGEVAKSFIIYESLLKNRVAKEVARAVLPMCSKTKLYMKGSLRSWIHYLEVRTDPGTQKEHREIAMEAQKILSKHFPELAKVASWV